MADCAPNCEVVTVNEMFNSESSGVLDRFGKVDFVVDAIDDIQTKVRRSDSVVTTCFTKRSICEE